MQPIVDSIKHRSWRLIYFWRPYLIRRWVGLLGRCREPDFLIIGAQRGGTTSLYNYLMQHPRIQPPLLKEIHYFDLNSHRSKAWYVAHFPPRKPPFITGEASPYYLFHPHVPARVANILPDVKIIALLRDPAARAFSNYHHAVRLGIETRSFAAAVAEEIDAIESGQTQPENTPAHREQSYVARGIYIQQLDRWLAHVPCERMLLLVSEHFFENPRAVLQKTLVFLGIPESNLTFTDVAPYNRGNYAETIPDEIREQLSIFYKPHNQRLSETFNLKLDHWQ